MVMIRIFRLAKGYCYQLDETSSIYPENPDKCYAAEDVDSLLQKLETVLVHEECKDLGITKESGCLEASSEKTESGEITSDTWRPSTSSLRA